MSKPNEITILHLSDLQFGKNHRFGRLGNTDDPDEPFDSLLNRLTTDLDGLKKSHSLVPDVVAVTGDIAEWGKKQEFEDALLFLTKLAENLKLPASRVLVVPGNHDINRPLCDSYFKDCEGNDEKPVEPYFKKWKWYVTALFEKLYQDVPQYTFKEETPWSLFEIPELHLVIAGLNSTIKESHRDDDHYGFAGERQLNWFKEKLEAFKEAGWFRLGLVHHNPFHGDVKDEELLRDKDDLDRILGSSLNLLLHGHRHEAKQNWLHQTLPVLSTGSASIEKSKLPDEVANQYQIIRLSADRLWFGGRAYSPTKKRWQGDNSVSKTGNEWFREETVSFEKTLEALEEMGPGELLIPLERVGANRRFAEKREHSFLDEVLEVHRLRQEKDGCRIQPPRMIEAPLPVNAYAEILKTEPHSAVVEQYALCAVEEITESFLACVLDHVHEKYRRRDPAAVSYIVVRKTPEAALLKKIEGTRIRLMSYTECQGLIDFESYLKNQTEKLESDPIYPPELYVPQRMEYHIGADFHRSDDALTELLKWMNDPVGRFLLVLGRFGTGKTFLIHEIARRLGSEGSPVTPLLIEMRRLEKAHAMDSLLAQHLVQNGVQRFDTPALQYMIKNGRVVLLFDGFDELALRLSYDKAADHLDTVLQALGGEAKVVVTSRPEHFESDDQISTALGKRVADLSYQKRTLRLQPFNNDQILHFLVNLHQGDEAKAKARFQLLDEIKDLLGLSAVPRMLRFIADIPEEELIRVKEREGSISAASLYRLLVERWIAYEVERYHPSGAEQGLTKEALYSAVEDAALMLWPRAERALRVSELPDAVARAVDSLKSVKRLDPQIAAHQVGSGSLLIRDKEGGFSFVHQSVLEWLTAAKAAKDLRENGATSVFSLSTMSELMVTFFIDEAGGDDARKWADQVPGFIDSSNEMNNASLVLKRLGEKRVVYPSMAGQNLRGKSFVGEDLTRVVFTKADLTEARLSKACLERADLMGAILERADLRDTDLTAANLCGADLSFADLCGASLDKAQMDSKTDLFAARLLDASISEEQRNLARTFGAALETASVLTMNPASSCTSVACRYDGKLIAAGYVSGIIILWDPKNGKEIRALKGHTMGINCVAFSVGGALLASGSDDKTVRLFEVKNGKELKALKGHKNSVNSVAFSADGALLASGSDDRTARLFELKSGKELKALKGHENSVSSVAFSADGALLASGSHDNTVRLFDVKSGKELKALKGHTDWVRSVAFSADGALLASGSYDNTVRLFDVKSGKELKALKGHEGRVNSVAFSADGALLASGSDDHTVRLFDVKNSKELKTLERWWSGVSCVAFSADGTLVASNSHNSIVRLFDVKSGKTLKALEGHRSRVSSVAFSADGALLASGSDDNTVRLFDVKSGKELKALKGHKNNVNSVAFNADGTLLASGSDDNTVRLFDVKSGKELKALKGHESNVNSVAFSADSALLASGSYDNTVRLFEVKSGKELKALKGHKKSVNSVAFNADGTLLASGSDDNTVRLFDVKSGKELKALEGHWSSVNSIAFSADGALLVSGSYDSTVRLFVVKSGKELGAFEGHEGIVNSVAFSADGALLASGSSDNTVRLFDMKSGNELGALKGHERSVTSVSFSPDGSLVASGSHDNTVRFWDVRTGRCLAALLSMPEGWVLFTPDGRYKVSGDIGGALWHTIGLCRFELGELDPYMKKSLRLPDDMGIYALRDEQFGS
jgi:WD40 repeat protein/3',5'-cyclic AMP phosphodiesterase CpdA